MLEVREVTFAYPQSGGCAVDGVSLALRAGERVAVVGRNGSGKSTLARLCSGSLTPCSGQVLVDDAVDAASSTLVGYVRQDPRNQVVSSLVFDEVAFGPRNLALPREEVGARVREALGSCGIEGLGQRDAATLSGGQLQLVAIAGVLAMRPRYLVLDEPTSQLDAASRVRVRDVLDSLAERGVGVIEVTHIAEDIVRADRVLVMESGSLVWEGDGEAFFASRDALEAAGLSRDLDASLIHRAVAGGMRLEGSLEPSSIARLIGGPCLIPRPAVPREGAVGHRLELSHCTARLSRDAERPALSDASLVAAGELVLVVGASGSGKTTAARILAGVLAPDEGEALLDRGRVRPGEVGLVSQRPEDQLFADTVFDDVAFGPRCRGLGADGVAEAVARAAGAVGLGEGLLGRTPFELSGGQMRRAALAGITAMGPSAYVFDEPTAALDADGRQELRLLVSGLVEEGSSVVVVTHDAGEWLELAGRVAFLEGGRVREVVPACELLADPGPFARAGLVAPLPVRVGSEFSRMQGTSGAACAPEDAPRVTCAPGAGETCEGGSQALGETVLDRLDPRVKLLSLLALSAAVFAAGSVAGLAVMAVALVCLLALSRTSPAAVARGLRPAAVVLAFSLLANTVVLVGNPELTLGAVGISVSGAYRGFWAVARIALVVGFVLVFSTSTLPPAVADAVGWLMSPLRRLGVPVDDASMAGAVALRFLPIASDELSRIEAAQRARGADFGQGGVLTRLRRWASLLVPLVVALFRRADELAGAMAERGYTGGRRTPSWGRLRAADVGAVAAVAAVALLASLL